MHRTAPAVLLAVLCAGCGGSDVAPVAGPVAEQVGVVTVVSDGSRATVEPLCVGELPEDYTTCAGAPANLGEVELDQTRRATVNVPTEVAQGGYRLRVNGTELPEHAGVLEEISQVSASRWLPSSRRPRPCWTSRPCARPRTRRRSGTSCCPPRPAHPGEPHTPRGATMTLHPLRRPSATVRRTPRRGTGAA